MRKTSQKNKVNTEALYLLCPCLFIILTIHTESQMQALALYLRRNYIWKGIWVGLQGAYIQSAYMWDFTVFQRMLLAGYKLSMKRS